MMQFAFFCIYFGLFLQIPASHASGHITTNTTLSTNEVLTTTKGENISLFWSYQVNSPAEFYYLIYGCKDKATNQTVQLATKSATSNSVLVLNVSSVAVSNELESRLRVNGNQLIIDDVQYNDSSYTYHASIKYKLSQVVYEEYLQPVVQLTVQGIPTFVSPGLTSTNVQDNGTLKITHVMEGNPLPALLSKWHHEPWIAYNIGELLYPFVAKASYEMKEIDRSYCGRIVNFRSMNSKGKSEWKGTTVYVAFKPNGPTNITATRIADCVNVKWIKEETGLCSLSYTVYFNDPNDVTLYTKDGQGIQEISQCGIPMRRNITSISIHVESSIGNVTISKSIDFLKGGTYGLISSHLLWLVSSLITIIILK